MTPTPRAIEVLQALHALHAETGRMPTLRELGSRADIASVSNVNFHLTNLEIAGMIQSELSPGGTRLARTWKFTSNGLFLIEKSRTVHHGG